MNNSCKDCLLKSDAEKKLNDSELANLSLHSFCKKFKKGELIIKQGKSTPFIIFCKTGLVKIHFESDNKERIFHVIKAPEYLFLTNPLVDENNLYSITAIEKAEICFIEKDAFVNLIKTNGEFALQILMTISRRDLDVVCNMVRYSLRQNMGKVAEILLFFSKIIYNNPRFILPLSRQELGNVINISRENVSRCLKTLHEEKVIEVKNKNINILDETRLIQIKDKG